MAGQGLEEFPILIKSIKINNPYSLGGADIRLRLAGRMPIRVYSMSRASLVPPLGKMFRSLLTFPFVGSFVRLAGLASTRGLMFTLGYGVCLEFPTLLIILPPAFRCPQDSDGYRDYSHNAPMDSEGYEGDDGGSSQNVYCDSLFHFLFLFDYITKVRLFPDFAGGWALPLGQFLNGGKSHKVGYNRLILFLVKGEVHLFRFLDCKALCLRFILCGNENGLGAVDGLSDPDAVFVFLCHILFDYNTKIALFLGFTGCWALPLNLLHLLTIVVLLRLVGDSTTHRNLLAEKGDFKFPIGSFDSLNVVLLSYCFLSFHITKIINIVEFQVSLALAGQPLVRPGFRRTFLRVLQEQDPFQSTHDSQNDGS